MKPLQNYSLILLAVCFIEANVAAHSPEPVVFVASSPCDRIPRSLLSIPADAECEFIKWNLALQRDPRNQSPTTYKLSYTYGMTKPNTTNFLNGGTRLAREGEWTIWKETGNREIYRLNAATPETTLSFVKMDDNVLHLLDKEGKLMIGHEGWSYTLNRK